MDSIYLYVVALSACGLLFALALSTPMPRRQVTTIYVLALSIRLIVTLAAYSNWRGHFLFLDDNTFDRSAWGAATAWKSGAVVNMNQLAGTVATGWYYVIAAIYYLFGHQWVRVLLVNTVAGAATVPIAASMAQELSDARSGRWVGYLLATFPLALFWNATGLKEATVTLLAVAFLKVALGHERMKFRFLLAAVFLLALYRLRPPIAITALAGAVFGHVVGLGTAKRQFRFGLVVAIGCVVGYFLVTQFVPVFPRGAVIVDRHDAPVFIQSYADPLRGVGYLGWLDASLRYALSPLPWIFDVSTETVYRWMFPGMWMWYGLLPIAVVGIFAATRHRGLRRRLSAGIIGFAAASAALYVVVFGDREAARQRHVVEVVSIIFVAVAMHRLPKLLPWISAAWALVVSVGIAAWVGVPMVFAITGICIAMAAVTVIARRIGQRKVSSRVRHSFRRSSGPPPVPSRVG